MMLRVFSLYCLLWAIKYLIVSTSQKTHFSLQNTHLILPRISWNQNYLHNVAFFNVRISCKYSKSLFRREATVLNSIYKYWDIFYEADLSDRAVCGRSLAGIKGSNSTESMDAWNSVSVLCVPEKKITSATLLGKSRSPRELSIKHTRFNNRIRYIIFLLRDQQYSFVAGLCNRNSLEGKRNRQSQNVTRYKMLLPDVYSCGMEHSVNKNTEQQVCGVGVFSETHI
jgi:hypothetical protein